MLDKAEKALTEKNQDLQKAHAAVPAARHAHEDANKATETARKAKIEALKKESAKMTVIRNNHLAATMEKAAADKVSIAAT
jgi:hypothetical protein